MSASVVAPEQIGELIVIEGLTGSGKSTVSAALAERLGYQLVQAVREEYRPVIRSLDNDRSGLDAHYAAYLSTVLATASAVKDFLDDGIGCVTDSWVHRTHLTHRILGSTLRVSDPDWLPRADAVFWLHVPEDVRRERVLGRGCPNTLWKERLEGLSSELEAAYFEHVPGLIQVDGSGAPMDVVERLVASLLRLRNRESNG